MDSKKRIIFKVSTFPRISETFVIHQAITAIELGYEIFILVHKKINFENSLHKELLSKYQLEDKIIQENIIIPKNKFFRLLKVIFLLLKYCYRFYDIYNFYKYQPSNNKSMSWIFYWVFYNNLDSKNTIFHVQFGNHKYPLDILKSKCNFKSKLIVSFHGHDAFFPMYGYIPNHNYYGLLFQGVDFIIANTNYLAEKIIELGCSENKIKIIPVAVNTNYFKPSEKVKIDNLDLKLINVGRLDPIKGQKYLIEIVKKLEKKGEKVQLNIIGEGEEREHLETLILNYGLLNKVILLGAKSQKEIRDHLQNSDLYLFTAVPVNDGRRETQGLATLEAQACGLPVIAYDSGGIKYTINNGLTGFVFEEYEIDKIVDKIIYLNKNRDVLEKMRFNCRNFIENEFSNNVLNKKWEVLYKDLLRK